MYLSNLEGAQGQRLSLKASYEAMIAILIFTLSAVAFLAGAWIGTVVTRENYRKWLERAEENNAALQSRCNNLAGNITELTNFADRNTTLVVENKLLKTRNTELESVVAEQGTMIAGAFGRLKRPRCESKDET